MNNPQGSDFIAPAQICHYGAMSSVLSEGALAIFATRISKYYWGLRHDGMIVTKKIEGDTGTISFTLDLEDRESIDAFNRLPQYFARNGKWESFPAMRMKVLAGVAFREYPFWTDEDNEDTLVFDEHGMHIESVKNIWDLKMQIEAIDD